MGAYFRWSSAPKLRLAGVAALTLLALGIGACTNDGGGQGITSPNGGATGGANGGVTQGESGPIAGTNLTGPLEPANITWLHNGNTEPISGFWQQVANEFMAAHPEINVTVTPTQNETLRDSVLPSALAGTNPPDLFQSWGGGELRDWANLGIAWNLNDVLAPTIATIPDTLRANWGIDGDQYGLPYTYGPAGFWVNLNVLNTAGLVQNATMDSDGNVVGGTVDWPQDLYSLFTLWSTIKEHGVTPVALGGGDNWPAAWWWYATAVKECSAAALDAAGNLHDFSDPCWVRAGEKLELVLTEAPFNDNWTTTSAQVGSSSSAALVATGQAAMEFTGPWGGRVMGDLTGTETIPPYIAWYPFPEITDGDGTDNLMASGDGFSVLNPDHGSLPRSNAAAALLAYIMSDDVQTRFATATQMAPTNPSAAASVSDPIVASQATAIASAAHIVPWLDVWFGDQIGSTMNQSISELMDGQGAPQGVVDTINGAAGN